MTKICDERPVECSDPACPCHEWSAKSPSEASRLENQPAGFLESEPKNVSEGEYGSGIAISAPDFEQEWREAPEIRRRYSYQEDAFYWFMRGVRSGQLSQMIEENRLFRAMAEQRGLKP